MRRFAVLLVLTSLPAMGALHYVDPNAPGPSHDGSSWNNAWTSFAAITGLAAGDTVYISGGSTSQAYSLSGWAPTGGTSGSPITYAVGQDAGHNGTVIITSSGDWLTGALHDVVINGNVAGDRHWTVNATGQFWANPSGTALRVRITYVTATIHGGFYGGGGGNGTTIEIDHNSFTNDHDYEAGHDFTFYGFPGTAAGAMSVHDNYIQFPVFTSNHGCGDDVWIWPGNVDFYNNTIKGQPRATYTGTCPGVSQHSDVFQNGGGANVHFYNNTIIDPGESVFYQDNGSAGTYHDIYIYNNLIVRTYACNDSERGFDMNPENNISGVAYQDMVIANNTFVDAPSCNFTIRVGGNANHITPTRVYVVNNLEYPSAINISADPGVTVSNNVGGSTTQFVSYTLLGGTNNDLHLSASDTSAKDQGTNVVASYFSTDKDGVSRPQGSAWDVGAYEYIASSVPTVTTTTATSITTTSASSGGTVTSNNGFSVTAEGVCWDTAANPVVGGTCTSDGTATPFTSSITGLTQGTLYHYRAFATNSQGTGYGSDLTFITLGPQLAISPALSFGMQAINTTSASQAVTISNPGTASATVSSITGLPSQGFAQSSTNCPATPFTLVSGGSCTLSITFTPASPGDKTTTVTVTDTPDSLSDSVGITGTGSIPVQTAESDQETAVTSGSVAFPQNNSSGNTVAICVRGGLNGETFTVTDSRSNNYQQAVQAGNATSNSTIAIYYAPNIGSGANTVQVQQSSAATLRFAIFEYPGTLTTDGVNSGSDTTGTSSAINSGNITTTHDADIILGCMMADGNHGYTVGNGFTAESAIPALSTAKIVAADLLQGTAGTVASTATLNSADNWIALIAGFRTPNSNGGPWTTHTWVSPSSLTWGNVVWGSGHTWANSSTLTWN